jgi:hypothetical protein
MMDKLVANDTADGAEQGGNKNEAKIIRICFWLLQIEQESLWVDYITHNGQTPNPSEDFENNIEMKWDIKPFVFFKHFG